MSNVHQQPNRQQNSQPVTQPGVAPMPGGNMQSQQQQQPMRQHQHLIQPGQYQQQQMQPMQHQQQQQVQPPAQLYHGQQQQWQQQPMYQQPIPQQQHPQQAPTTEHNAVAGSQSKSSSSTAEGDGAGPTPTSAMGSGFLSAKNPLHTLGLRFKSTPASDGPNVGFTPTPAMVKAHEQEQSHTLAGGESSSQAERPLYQFQVTKLRSWRTGYVRLLCLYRDRFSTFDPDSHQVTNTWSYSSLSEWLALPKEKDTLLLQVNADKLKFKCHNVDRALVLTALLQCKSDCEKATSDQNLIFVSCARQTRHGTRQPMSLEVAPHGLMERHATTRQLLQTYLYRDIKSVAFTSDDNTGILLNMSSTSPPRSRLFFIQSSRRHGNGRSDLVTILKDNYEVLGLELNVSESRTLKSWMDGRRALGKSAGPIVSSWDVTKKTRRHDAAIVGPEQGVTGGTVTRRLAVTGRACLLEMDGSGVVSCRRLADLHALVRQGGDRITLEYVDGSHRTYASSNRDALLVSLLDSATSLGRNPTVHVTDVTSGGYCLTTFHSMELNAAMVKPTTSSGMFQPISIPIHCLKQLHAASTAAYAFLTHATESSVREGEPLKVAEECGRIMEACREFNASVPPTGEGLPASLTDKHIMGSAGALWGILTKLLLRPTSDNANVASNSRDWHHAELVACPMFQSLYRLTQTPAGYKGTVELTTMQDCIPLLLGMDDAFAQFWALRVLSVIIFGPVDADSRDREIEYVNKSVVLRIGGTDLVDGLVSTLLDAGSQQPNGQQHVSDLILMVTSDILQSVLCSHHDTTSPEHFRSFIDALAKRHRALLSALMASTPFIIENTALLLHLLSTHAPHTSTAVRDAALSSGILLQHFYAANFSPLEGQRFLSRYLCSLWLSGPMECDEKRLLKRMVPSGFLGYLKMPPLSRMEEEQLDEIERDAIEEGMAENDRRADEERTRTESAVSSSASGTNTARLRSRIAIATASAPGQVAPENFRIFFHVLTKDHALPDLIWNQQTRRELRIALESELQSVRRATEARGGIDNIAWNHQQFTVVYPSLKDEVQVGSVYMRLWLQAGDGFIKTWDEPLRLFELLFRRFLCELDRNTTVTIMCIRCLERLYSIHSSKIGTFSDIMIMVRSMATTKSIETQHRLLGLLSTLLGVSTDEDKHGRINIPGNAEQLLNAESISQLSQFVAWGHTNELQVGNLLATVLGDSAIGNPSMMITDGTDTGPQGRSPNQPSSNSDSSAQRQASDTACPPVWFVATTGKIPPPPDTIRGPFRVSELVAMMLDGDLFPHSLVTASHVETYNEDEDEAESSNESTSVREAQIDTGKWRMVEQVWQLRWQLCTDGTSTGVYDPSEVALMALRSLSRLVDLHRSVDTRGVPYYPIPIAKRLLCGLSRDLTTAGGMETHGSMFKPGVVLDQRDSLSILSQILLCNDYRVVEAAAELLYKLMEYNNEACSKLYLTGVFLFICCYTGSNFHALGKLLHATHFKQHFRSGFAAAADESDLPMKDRSILGSMLPEGVLFMLVNYGYERFTEVFVGNFDTPEVIWNFEMRKHLVEMIRQHLGDFPKRLWQNTTTKYEYCPFPGVAYKRLEKEIFCHNYYLANLCDEVRFPSWPVAEPVEVFRACLEEWKQQMNRDENKEEDAQEEARKVLSLKTGDGGSELRRAYRTLARKYHPDKNPAGREMFETIQAAYELLLPIVESGAKIVASPSESEDADAGITHDEPTDNSSEGLGGGSAQMQSMHLLIKTQVLLCKRYADEMSKYKYPAYRMLLSCLQIPSSCQDIATGSDPNSVAALSLVKAARASFVQTSVELLFQTCLVSPLNAEELIVEGGVPVLDALLDFYVSAACVLANEGIRKELSRDELESVASGRAILDIISHVVHTIAGVAFYENGRKAILSLAETSRLCVNWRRCVDGKFVGLKSNRDDTSTIKKFALEGIAHMAKTREIQNLLIGSGVVWPLTRNLLGYDPTLEPVSTKHDGQDDVNMSQAASNAQARLSARALGLLCGVMKDPALLSPPNASLFDAMKQLLTGPIGRLLRNKRTEELLRTLNANVETPVRIWNVRMREELSDFLAKMEKDRADVGFRPLDDELKPAILFEYSALKNEITIGGVYLRVFNAMGGGREGLREIADSTKFAKAIIGFVARSMNDDLDFRDRSLSLPLSNERESQKDTPLAKAKELESVSISDPRFLMAVSALRLLVRVDGLIDDVLCDDSILASSVLLSLLELPFDSEVYDVGSDILAMMTPKQEFADAVARQGELWRLLMVLERPEGEADMVDNDEQSASATRAATRRQERGWSLLESLSSSPTIASKLVQSSGWLELLGILAGYSEFSKKWVARSGAARTLSRLLWDPKTGSLAAPLIQRFLPAAMTVVLKEEGPDVMLKLFDGESETPELIWDATMRGELRTVLKEQLDRCLKARRENAMDGDDFSLQPEIRVKYQKLEDELYIGGVYVRLFLKEPTYKLRDPTTFLEMLLLRWTHELEGLTSSSQPSGDTTPVQDSDAITEARQDSLQLVTSACVYLCKVQENLCDKLAQWGYMAKALLLMHAVLSVGLIGTPLLSIIRVLHVASNRRVNVEAIAVAGGSDGKHGVVDYTIQSFGSDPLHRDSAFMVELLKKIFREALGDVQKNAPKRTKIMSSDPPPRNDAQTISPAVQQYDASSASPDNLNVQPMFSPGQHRSGNGLLPSNSAAFNAMAPSPAPGSGPVSSRDGSGLGTWPSDVNAFYAMAPSPAPGPGPVSKSSGKVPVDSFDDPLAMFRQEPAPSPTNQPTSSGINRTSGTDLRQQFGVGGATPSSQGTANIQQTPAQEDLLQSTQSTPSVQHGRAPSSSAYNHHVQHQQAGQHIFQDPLAQPGPTLNTTTGQHSIQTRPYPPYAISSQPQATSAIQQTHMPKAAYQDPSQNAPQQRGQVLQVPMSTSSQVASGHTGSYRGQTKYQPQQYGGGLQVPAYASEQSVHQQTPSMSNASHQQGLTQQQSLQTRHTLQQQGPSNQPLPMQQSTHQQVPSQQPQHTQPMSSGQGLEQQPLQGHHMPQQPSSMQQPLQGHHLQQQQQQQQQSMQQPQGQQMSQHQGFSTGQRLSGQSLTPQQGTMQQQPLHPAQQIPSQTYQGPVSTNQQPYGTRQPAPAPQAIPSDSVTPQQHDALAPQQQHTSDSMQVPPAEPAPPQRPYLPTAVEGSGVDARTPVDPAVVAEQTSLNTPGAPGCAQGRVALLLSALACELPRVLLEDVLENATLSSIKDPAAAKVHAVELLKLLTMDPGYGMKFQLILDGIPAWKKYKSQDHSLFITGSEQKADYFLTDGGTGEAKKLLTQE